MAKKEIPECSVRGCRRLQCKVPKTLSVVYSDLCAHHLVTQALFEFLRTDLTQKHNTIMPHVRRVLREYRETEA